MTPKYSLQVCGTSNLYPATCIRQHVCIRIEVALPGDMCPGVKATLQQPVNVAVSLESRGENGRPVVWEFVDVAAGDNKSSCE